MQVEETEVFISLVPLCPSGCRSPAGRRNGRPARKPANNPRRTVSAEEEDEEEDEDEEDEDEEEEEDQDQDQDQDQEDEEDEEDDEDDAYR